jgi:hypothetical protein
LLTHKGNLADAALCIGGDRVPPQVASAVHCAQTSDSITGFGVCMVASEGGGEAQRIAACYAEGNGIPAAVAVCLASQYLTQDQRIVLECAAATNGAPPATATCAVGKYAMKEMINCKGKTFGEGKCFNENGEIRKFFKNVGMDIGPQTVAGQIINYQLQMTQFAMGPVVDAASRALPELMNIATKNGLIPDPSRPGTWITSGIGGPLGAEANEFCKHNPCDPTKIRLPNLPVKLPW